MEKISRIAELWEAHNYKDILTERLPIFDMVSPGGHSLCDIVLSFVHKCPKELQEQHTISMLRFACLLYLAEKHKQANDLMQSIRAGIEKLQNKNERQTLLGEWTFVTSLFRYPNIDEMLQTLRQADELVDGRVTVLEANDPFLIFLTDPAAVFHTEVGQADVQGELFAEFVALYEKLTNGGGCGAAELYRAGIHYYRGDFNGAQLLCYKAVYLAESTGQASLQIGAAGCLGRISIHNMDMEVFSEAVDMLKQAAGSYPEYGNATKQMMEYERNELYLEIPITEYIPDWIKKGVVGSFPGMTYSFIKYAQLRYFFYTEKYEQCIGLGEALLRRPENYGVLLHALIGMFVACSYLQLGDHKYGLEQFKEYLPLLFKDRLYLVFAYFYETMDGILDDYLREEYPDDIDAIFALMEEIRQGRRFFMQTYLTSGNDLSEKERAVAELAAAGLQNKEISKRLGISPNTVRAHLRKIFEKLEISRRGEISERLNVI